MDSRLTRRIGVGLAGPIGAGKTTAGTFLHLSHGFQYVRYSQVLSECFAGGNHDREILQRVGWEVMSDPHHQRELNEQLIGRLCPDQSAAVDGLRHEIDAACLREHFDSSFVLLYIDAPEDVRQRRLTDVGMLSEAGMFQAANHHRVEGAQRLLKTSAYSIVDNSGSIEELYGQLSRLIADIQGEGQS